MNAVEKIRAANSAALRIIGQHVEGANAAPDAVALRKAELLAGTPTLEELLALNKTDMVAAIPGLFNKVNELVDLIVGLEKPKTEGGVKIEVIAKALLEEPACAILTYDQIAGMITTAVSDSKTSQKSIASYVSKHKEDWNVVPRERFKPDMASLLAIIPQSAGAEPAESEVEKVVGQ